MKYRSGTLDDHVYLCSPETAAAALLSGATEIPVIPYAVTASNSSRLYNAFVNPGSNHLPSSIWV